MRLLHLSDTHLHDPQWSTYHPEIDSAVRLDAVLAATREHGPFDAIVLTGDVTDDYSVVGALAVHERLTAAYPGVPLLVVPGNHDLTESVREVFPDPSGMFRGWRVVAVATNVRDQIEGEAAATVAALDEIDPADPTPLLVLQHHPLRSRSRHEWFVLRDEDALAARLDTQIGPVVLLSGHTHQAFELVEGHVHHLGGPASYYAIEHAGEAWDFAPAGTGTGFQVIDLGPDRVESVTVVEA